MTGRIVDSETVFRYERECACERVNFPGQGSLAVNWPVVAHPHPAHPRRTHTQPLTHQLELPELHDDPWPHRYNQHSDTIHTHVHICIYIYIYI